MSVLTAPPMQQTLTTSTVTARDRVAFWVDMICSTYVRLDCDPAPDGAFTGSIDHHRLPGLDLSVVRSGAQSVLRTARTIARDPEDYYLVALQTQGTGGVEQDGRQALMSPGDVVIYDSTRPYTLHFDGAFEEVVMKVRGDALRTVVRDAPRLTALRVPGEGVACRLLGQTMLALRRDLAGLTPAVAATVGDAMLSLVAASLQALPAVRPVEASALRVYHVERIKRFIDEHLQDPTLTIENVAGRLGLSVAHVHRLFAEEPLSPSQYLWRKRLERCSRDLHDPRSAGRTVSEIAFSWGFNDAAHFSRAFRDRFGCPPREWRRCGAAQRAA